MTRIVARETSQAAEDKDPKAIRPDVVGKRRLAEHIVEDRADPAALKDIQAEIDGLVERLNEID